MITRIKLKQLSDDCAKLLFCSESIEGSNTKELMECNREIKQSLRKIIIANEISDRMIICVTGLQGTGKTSLMKNYYDIEDDIMNIALGRGERLPVLITEDDVSKTCMYAVGIEKIKDGYCTKRVEVEASEFIELSKAEDEDSTIMYMELIVPRKYVGKSTKISYMLLPGYERKENYWNTLIEFSVKCADTAIFVLTAEKVADANNAKLLEKIAAWFGENIIYVISHSDEKADRNENVKKTLMELMNADSSQEQRFVCTGAYATSEMNDRWKKELQKAIECYSADPHAADQRNMEYLEEIIITELRPAVITIKKFVTDVTDELLTGFEQSSWLKTFDSEAAYMRKKLQKALSDELKKAQNMDRKDLLDIMQTGKKQDTTGEMLDEKNFSDRIEDFLDSGKRKVGYLRRNIFGESLKDVEESKQLIDDAMKNSWGQYRYQKAFINAIVNHTDMLCSKLESDSAPQIGGSSIRTILQTKKSEEKGLILQDVTTILSADTRKKQLVSSKPMDTVKAIVKCGTQYFGLCMVDDLYSEQYISVPELAKSSLSKDDIAKSIKDSEKFAMTILGVTGMDLLGDGVLNFIPSLASSLAISVPVASAIVTGIIGAGALKSIISDYNKLQLKDFYSYGKAIAYVYDEVEKKYLDMYDDFIAELRVKVEKYLIECVGANEVMVNKQNALIAVKNIQEDLDAIRKEIKDDSYEPTKLIRG